MKCRINKDTALIEVDYENDSMLFKGDYIWTIYEYAPNKLFVFSQITEHRIYLIDNWQIMHIIHDTEPGNTDKQWVRPLPSFDLQTFPFLVAAG